jgi:uncharacterized protein YaaW (UPF0174 family)
MSSQVGSWFAYATPGSWRRLIVKIAQERYRRVTMDDLADFIGLYLYLELSGVIYELISDDECDLLMVWIQARLRSVAWNLGLLE